MGIPSIGRDGDVMPRAGFKVAWGLLENTVDRRLGLHSATPGLCFPPRPLPTRLRLRPGVLAGAKGGAAPSPPVECGEPQEREGWGSTRRVREGDARNRSRRGSLRGFLFF